MSSLENALKRVIAKNASIVIRRDLHYHASIEVITSVGEFHRRSLYTLDELGSYSADMLDIRTVDDIDDCELRRQSNDRRGPYAAESEQPSA